jgi:integrase
MERPARQLGQVTEQQVRDGIREVTGSAAQRRLDGLRSIFGALRAERCIPSDPTRSIKLGTTARVPVPLRDDQLRGLIGRADGPRAQLIVALVAIHALNVQELRALTIDALDTRAGTLTVPRARNRTHTLYLDDVTRDLMRRWLAHRQEEWPTSPNPHLLISMYGAHAPNTPPLAQRTITLIFRGLHLQANRVRSDRILYEASVTEDPVLLMRVFGISTVTAMRYLHAAHPHRSRPSR